MSPAASGPWRAHGPCRRFPRPCPPRGRRSGSRCRASTKAATSRSSPSTPASSSWAISLTGSSSPSSSRSAGRSCCAICLDPLQDAAAASRLGAHPGPRSSCTRLVTLRPACILARGLRGVRPRERGPPGRRTTPQRSSADRGGAGAWLAHGVGLRFASSCPSFLRSRRRSPGCTAQRWATWRASRPSRAEGLLARAAGRARGALSPCAPASFCCATPHAFAADLRRLLPFGHAQNERLVILTRDLVSASVTATVAIAVARDSIGGIALRGPRPRATRACGASSWACLSFLPLVGATLVGSPPRCGCCSRARSPRGWPCSCSGLSILGSVDNVVRPLLLSGKARMNTLRDARRACWEA